MISNKQLIMKFKSNSFKLGLKFDMGNQLKGLIKIIEEVCPSE